VTLVDRPPTPDVRQSLAPTSNTDLGVTCHCGDASVERLRDLIAQGVPQFEASRLLWGPPLHNPVDPEPPLPRFRWIGSRERSC
jgi:hypothetical protein